MKRRREKMPKATSSGSKTARGELVSSSSAEDSVMRSCSSSGSEGQGSQSDRAGKVKEKSSLSRLADLTINDYKEEEKSELMDFNDIFPDEILVQIFKHVFRPEIAGGSAKVCKRWHVLQAINLLQKRSNGRTTAGFKCKGSKKEKGDRRKPHCDGKTKILKLNGVQSEWHLSMDLLQSCKRHVHHLQIKNCTHLSQRGYQLISAFASNLKSIRLESCNSLDDVGFDVLLDNCRTLRSVHLTSVDLNLVNLVGKAPKLQELHVHGCRKVTVKTLLTIVDGLTNLRSLSLTAMGDGPQEWDGTKFESGPPLRLQHLHLENSLAVSDRLLGVLGPRLENLKKLDLSLCTMITDTGLREAIGRCGTSLTSIILYRCRRITDEGIVMLTKMTSNLRDVSFAGCAISDEGMRNFMGGDFIPKLRNLCLSCCSKLTDGWLLHFASQEGKLAHFKTLDLQNCTGISAFGLKHLPPKVHGKAYKVLSEKRNVIISE